MADSENDLQDDKEPLTFSPAGKDEAKKDEREVRNEERKSFEKALGDTGAKPPLPDSIKLAHPKRPFVEAIESLFQAAEHFLKQLNPQNKDNSRDKNKPS